MDRTSIEVESSRRLNKRRRRSRSDEKRISKKQETTSTLTFSERSQTTSFPRDVQNPVTLQENIPPNLPTSVYSTELNKDSFRRLSFCFSASESTENVSSQLAIYVAALQKYIEPEMSRRELSLDVSAMSHTAGKDLDEAASQTSAMEPSVSTVSRWSRDDGTSIEDGETDHLPYESLCEKLRDSLSFEHQQRRHVQWSYVINHGLYSGDIDSDMDDGEDAFADEEWTMPSTYAPVQYNEELDWEE